MIMMLRKYKKLKDYKGYGIDKVWQVDCHGKKISGTDIYLVSEGEDYVGEEYKSLKEAKNQIDISLIPTGKPVGLSNNPE